MKELKTLTTKSTFEDYYNIFQYNKEIVGYIAVRQDVYFDFIKILCIFPLKDKKLKYFLKLDPKAKTGFMSKYIMKVAKKVQVPNSIIESFHEIKERKRIFNKYKKSPKEVSELLSEDIKKFLKEYSYNIKDDVYTEILSKMTQNLCSAIFEQYDRARTQMLKEQ